MIWAILPLVATLSGQALNGTQPKADQPLVQIDLLPVAERMIQALKDGRHGRSEREAHEEVVRALSAFCSVNICDVIR
jgi:hypothetical protein